ncbi:MAG: hypothetical protein AABX38_04640 [Candidatus Micrarchaeota archaeon]
MANVVVTVSIPSELKNKMNDFPETNWSELMREFLSQKVNRMEVLKQMDEMLKNSELTEEDVERVGKLIKQKAWQKTQKMI